MKKVLSDNITADARQPFLQATFDHLQESYTDIFAGWFKSMLTAAGLSESVISLGADITTNNFTDWTVTAGWIFYNGEFYEVTQTDLTTTTSEVVLKLAADEFIGGVDPVEFSDQNTHNVHLTKKAEFVEDSFGSGLVDYDKIVFFKDVINARSLTEVETLIVTGSGVGEGINNGAGLLKEYTRSWNVAFNVSLDSVFSLTGFAGDYEDILSYDVLLKNTVTNKIYKSPLYDNAGTLTYETTIEDTASVPDLRVKVASGGFFDSADLYNVIVYVKYKTIVP